jgi:hypothetical protein
VAVGEVCGNDYNKTFQTTLQGRTHTFDSCPPACLKST